MNFSETTLRLVQEAEEALKERFCEIDAIALEGTRKVMDAFARHRVSDSMFAGTTGYGYNDRGRETLDAVYADVFGAEAALVRHSIVNGTQALAIGLYGLLRPGDTLLSVTGKPYDTLEQVIGISGEAGNGSLADFGVAYREVAFDGSFDYPAIEEALKDPTVKVVFLQRSKGYLSRPTLSPAVIGEVIAFVKARRPEVYVFVDNCYGEFCDTFEPTAVGCDLMAGSLIKNAGGGMALSGGYLAGTARAVELASYRLTTVGVGNEVGATLGQNRDLFKGFFYAPHTVAQAIRTATLAAYVFEKIGLAVEPHWSSPRYDIIQQVKCGTPELLCAFCRGIQKGSPVDAFATPIPDEMPGYSDKVIMAAGAFVQGASIELSADGPLRPPYTAYFQGGLTYESGKLGIMSALDEVLSALGGDLAK